MASKTLHALCFLNYTNYTADSFCLFTSDYFPEKKPVGDKLIHTQDLTKAMKTKHMKLSLEPSG